MGSPGKVKRSLTAIENEAIEAYAKRYVTYKNVYKDEAAGKSVPGDS